MIPKLHNPREDHKVPFFQNPTLDLILHANMTVTAGEVEESFRQGEVAAAKRKLRQLIQQGSIPRFLRAVEVVKGGKKKVYHFVEWHSGQAKLLMAPTSYTQLCVYKDLGEVRKHCATLDSVEEAVDLDE